MKITELLESIDPKLQNHIGKGVRKLQEAINPPEDDRDLEDRELDDEDLDDEDLDDEDLDDSEDDEDQDGDDDYIDSVKTVAGDIGDDLWSVTMFNTEDNFARIGPMTVIVGELSMIDDQVVQDYLDEDPVKVADNNEINSLIMNTRNGAFVHFIAGTGGVKFIPSLAQLSRAKTFDQDQITRLKNIENSGRSYSSAVKKVDWSGGDQPEGSKRAVDAAVGWYEQLKYDLSLNELRDAPPRQLSSKEQKEQDKINDKIEQAVRKKLAALKANKSKVQSTKKQSDSPRQKR